MFPRPHTTCSLMWAWEDVNGEMNAGIASLSTTASVCSDIQEAMLVRAQTDSIEWDYEHFCPKRTQMPESNQPRLCCLRRLLFHRKQFLSSLSSLEVASQIIATYAFDNVINRPIYSALVAAVFLQWRSSDIKKRAYIAPFSMWLSFLAFLRFTWPFIWHHLISVLSFPLFLMLRQAAAELAFSLVDMVMRQTYLYQMQFFFHPYQKIKTEIPACF